MVVIFKIKRLEKKSMGSMRATTPKKQKTETVMVMQLLHNTYIDLNDATYESASLHTQ